MKRVPVAPTILVVLAALLMVRLGVWQLHRLHDKEALLARYAANGTKPPLPFAALFPVREQDLYRRASALCLGVTGWSGGAGRSSSGMAGYRHIAECRTGAEGPGIAVDMGISTAPTPPPWHGGAVRGRLIWAPSAEPFIARLIRPAPPPSPMIVNEVAAPGLQPTIQPNPADIPNNHLSYAVQWFLFAAVALVIYAVALWQRWRRTLP
jgi:surfeit locus 1 family protein